MGDWAEQRLTEAIVRACPEWKVSQYGATNRIAAGHPEFRTACLAGLEQTRQFGKRPDLLLFPVRAAVAADLSTLTPPECDPLLKHAFAAVEVRSSKFEALTYMEVRRRQRDAGTSSASAENAGLWNELTHWCP
jgi:hypothetical protein